MRSPIFLASSLVLLACGNGTDGTAPTPNTCPSTTSVATLELPANLPAPVSKVKADPPCAAVDFVGGASDGSTSAVAGNAAEYLMGIGRETITAPFTCRAYASLKDGTTLVASVTFHPLGGSDSLCWGLPTTDTPIVPFEYERDAGTD
jgi:hypothetical protein